MLHTVAAPWMWGAFFLFVVGAIYVDLAAIRHKGEHTVGFREALGWSLLWISLALVFNALLWFWIDQHEGRALANQKATEFLTGYVIEKSLSVDNLFVFMLLFRTFAVPGELQKHALIIGVVGAIILRTIMILIGAWLISQFHWILYLFGAFLVYTGIKMLVAAEEDPDIEQNPVLHWMRGHLNLTRNYESNHFWFRRDGIRWYTPLFVVVALIAVTDVIFAVDSIPAIFAVTTDPFIVMTSNIFAVLGLRALYFMLAGMADRFHLLKFGLAFVLAFIGIKMLIVEWYAIPTGASLAVVAMLLTVSIVASLLRPEHKE
ncbi:MAG TPA: TerC family protein [Rhodocyclaceae bacterium]